MWTKAGKFVAVAFLLAAVFAAGGAKCSLKAKSGKGTPGGNRIFVVTTDYSSGAYSTVDVATQAAAKNIQTIHSDAVARTFGGLVYVVNRAGQSNITVINPDLGYAPVRQFSTNDLAGPDSNPQDIEFLTNVKAYVTRYDYNTVLIVNPASGTQLGTINLASMLDPDGAGGEPNDPDGKVEMSGACIRNGILYVTVQRLDRTAFYAPVGKSYVVRIDTATDTVLGSIELAYANPSGDLAYIAALDRLATVCSGSFGVADGALELIDPNSNVLDGTMLLESALTGDFNDFVVLSSTQAYVLYNDFSFNLKVQRFNPTSGTPAGTDVLAVSGFNLSGMCFNNDGSKLYLGDRTSANPGVRIYNTAGDTEITTAPIDTGLPPFALVYVP